MTTINQIRITKAGNNTWVNVEHSGKDVQFDLINAEDVSEDKVKEVIGMAFSICPNFEAIEAHCKLNGVIIQLDEIFDIVAE